MLNTDKMAAIAYSMYEGAKKHSSELEDLDKFEEEYNELYIAFMDGVRELDNMVYEEFADMLHMIFRLLFWTYNPKSEQDAQEIFYHALEWYSDKAVRQLNERGWKN